MTQAQIIVLTAALVASLVVLAILRLMGKVRPLSTRGTAYTFAILFALCAALELARR